MCKQKTKYSQITIYPRLVLVQPRKTRPCLTERLLMGRKESNQMKQSPRLNSRSSLIRDYLFAFLGKLFVAHRIGISDILPWDRKIESIIGVQWGQKNPNPRAHRSSGKRGLPSFPLNGGPEGWDFSGTTEHQ